MSQQFAPQGFTVVYERACSRVVILDNPADRLGGVVKVEPRLIERGEVVIRAEEFVRTRRDELELVGGGLDGKLRTIRDVPRIAQHVERDSGQKHLSPPCRFVDRIDRLQAVLRLER